MNKLQRSFALVLLVLGLVSVSFLNPNLSARPRISEPAAPPALTEVLLDVTPSGTDEVLTEVQSFAGIHQRISDNLFSGVAPHEVRGSLPIGNVHESTSVDGINWTTGRDFFNSGGGFDFRADPGNVSAYHVHWQLLNN